MSQQIAETNDCTVKAVSRAFGISYEAAHELMRISGRENREGHYDFRYWAQNQNCSEFFVFLSPAPTLRQFLTKQGRSGCWLVAIPGHAFAIQDGQILNDYPLSESVHLSWAARTDGTSPKRVSDPKRNEVSRNLLEEFRRTK